VLVAGSVGGVAGGSHTDGVKSAALPTDGVLLWKRVGAADFGELVAESCIARSVATRSVRYMRGEFGLPAVYLLLREDVRAEETTSAQLARRGAAS